MWYPTARLRWIYVDQKIPVGTYGGGTITQKVRVLQQFWERDEDDRTEWRDIPTELDHTGPRQGTGHVE